MIKYYLLLTIWSFMRILAGAAFIYSVAFLFGGIGIVKAPLLLEHYKHYEILSITFFMF